VQRFGTGRVGFCFAPIVLIYFLCNLIIAITNISRYKPDIFKVNSLCAAKHWRFCDKYALANCMGPSAVTRSACIELCCWYCGKGSKMAESPTCCNFAHVKVAQHVATKYATIWANDIVFLVCRLFLLTTLIITFETIITWVGCNAPDYF